MLCLAFIRNNVLRKIVSIASSKVRCKNFFVGIVLFCKFLPWCCVRQEHSEVTWNIEHSIKLRGSRKKISDSKSQHVETHPILFEAWVNVQFHRKLSWPRKGFSNYESFGKHFDSPNRLYHLFREFTLFTCMWYHLDKSIHFLCLPKVNLIREFNYSNRHCWVLHLLKFLTLVFKTIRKLW